MHDLRRNKRRDEASSIFSALSSIQSALANVYTGFDPQYSSLVDGDAYSYVSCAGHSAMSVRDVIDEHETASGTLSGCFEESPDFLSDFLFQARSPPMKYAETTQKHPSCEMRHCRD